MELLHWVVRIFGGHNPMRMEGSIHDWMTWFDGWILNIGAASRSTSLGAAASSGATCGSDSARSC